MKNSREVILENIKTAVKIPGHHADMPDDAERKVAEGLQAAAPVGAKALAEQFKQEIEKVAGECHIVSSEADVTPLLVNLLDEIQCAELALDSHPLSVKIGRALQQKMPRLKLLDSMSLKYDGRRTQLAQVAAGLVTADYGIADAATLVAFYDERQSNMAHFLPTVIFTILPGGKLTPNLFDMMAQLDKEKAKNMVLITGPSRTADIEKILILGAHGPKRLVVFIVG